MTARIVMVTTNHPFAYTGGETMFVAPELTRLVRELGATARLTLAPLHAEGSRANVPDGVEVDTSLSDAMRRERVSAYLRALRWPGFLPELGRAWTRGGWLGVVRAWRWAAAAQITWHWACQRFPVRATPTANEAVLFYTYWRGGPTLALARLAQTRPRTLAITRVHRYELYEESFAPPYQPWHPSMYEQLALTATISRDGHDYLARAGVPPDRLGLFRLGTEPARAPARASADGAVRIVSCSNVIAVKRVPRVAEAAIAFARAHPDLQVRWTHFGGGPQLADVRSVLADAPANLQVHLAGAVPHAAVIEHYAAEPVDAFVMLSESEGLPVSIQEAASAAIPVIATDVGGVRELVGEDNGVLLAAEPTTGEVVQALERVLRDDDSARSQRRRAASHARWAQAFDAEANHTRFARRLQGMLDSIESDPGHE